MKKIGQTNPLTKALIDELGRKAREDNNPFMKDIAIRLSKSSRARIRVNLSKISRLTKKGDTILVPGKVLSAGKLEHPLIISALDFSQVAEEKITAAGGKAISIEEFIKENKNARILV